MLKSDVPINIEARWTGLGEGVLGSARSSSLFKDFENAPFEDTWYSVALAEKIARKELNGSDQPDINASFSSDFDWYLGVDGQPGNKYDLVTVVMHEIGHGLGFSAIGVGNNAEGLGFYLNNGSRGMYSPFIVNQLNQSLLNFENASSSLGGYLTSDKLVVNSPLAVESNGGTPPKLYAPTTYNGGSSISHWNDATYDRTVNALMTHAVSGGESIFHPGPNTLSLFADMGWVRSGFEHESISLADVTKPLVISTGIFSDTSFSVDNLAVRYFYGGSSDTLTLPMIEVGGEYSASIELDASQTSLSYFITGLTDGIKKSYTSPARLNEGIYTVSFVQGADIPYALADGGDFESNTEDFVATNISGTGFSLGNSTISGKDGTNSGATAWVFGLTQNGYSENSEAYLYSPAYDFSRLGQYELNFFAKYGFEEMVDGFLVEYTDDQGRSWKELDNEVRDNWNDVISNLSSSLGPNNGIFTGSTDNVYENKFTDISFLGGNSVPVTFRIVVKTDENPSVRTPGLAIDDFQVFGPAAGLVSLAFNSELVAGSLGCDGQLVMIEGIPSGSVGQLEWDFGTNATPSTASGIGPHEVLFALGESLISASAYDFEGTLHPFDSLVIAGELHTPIITVEENEDGTFGLAASAGEAYQWYLNGDSIERASSQTYVASESGEYSVDVVLNSCLGLSSAESIRLSVLSSEQRTLVIYPNPVQDFVQLDFGYGETPKTVNVLDLSGKTLISQSNSLGQIGSMDLSRLTTGIYFLEVVFEDSYIYREKIVKR